MLDCLVLGDSLAVGVGQARPGCATFARTGITSGTYLQSMFPSVPRVASSVVISLGVNDDPTMPTLDNLRRMRRELRSPDVIWLLPGLKDEIRRAIHTVAAEFGDRLLDSQKQAGPDHLHPSSEGYRLIASWTEGASRAHGSAGKHVRSAAGLEYATLDPTTTVRSGGNSRRAGSESRPAGNLPLVIYPNTFNGRVVYGLWPPPGTPYAALPPVEYAFGALRRP